MWTHKYLQFYRNEISSKIFLLKIQFKMMLSIPSSRQAPSISIIAGYFAACFANTELYETSCCSTLFYEYRRFASSDADVCDRARNPWKSDHTWLNTFLKKWKFPIDQLRDTGSDRSLIWRDDASFKWNREACANRSFWAKNGLYLLKRPCIRGSLCMLHSRIRASACLKHRKIVRKLRSLVRLQLCYVWREQELLLR